MGSKTEAKKIAHGAGVALVPGYHGDDQSPDHLAREAARIGYPILIKASAGGGGKGMRRVEGEREFFAQLTLAKTEALRAFGDDRVLLERLIQRPRHLEVQLAGDRHGNLVHLYERECSIQRSYQKVIEEAPAAYLSEETRTKLFDYALRLGREIGYDSLGTVEFVLEAGTDEPYFLEMNTRLQVEHPVTEATTGLDLVEMQLRIAAGEPLAIRQEDLACRGWAIEARVNCENPARDYRPELGTIVDYHAPAGADLRVESGVDVGSVVGPHYDSMVAKLIGRGATRAAAARALRAGLDDFEALGIGTNQLFARDMLAHPHFLDRPLTTGFIADTFPEGWSAGARVFEGARAVAAFCELHGWDVTSSHAALATPWTLASGFRNVSRTVNHGWARFAVSLEGDPTSVWIAPVAGSTDWRVRSGETETMLAIHFDGSRHVRAGELRFGFFRDRDGRTFVTHLGNRFAVDVQSEVRALAAVAGAKGARSGTVAATLPGLVTTVNVVVDQVVQAGDVVVVMESMKLMFSMKAPITGRVAAVLCEAGQNVSNAQTLIEIAAIAEIRET